MDAGSTSICIIEIDVQGIITRVNAELANVLTIKNELLIVNQPIEYLFHESEINEFKKCFQFALNGNVVKSELITKIKFGNDNLIVNFIPQFDENDIVK